MTTKQIDDLENRIDALNEENGNLEQEVEAQKLIVEQLKVTIVELNKQIQLYRLKIQSVALVLRD